MPTTLATQKAGWNAELELEFASDKLRTVLARRRHVGPLIVQRPFYPEGPVCHTYILHPPGGVVGGDVLQLSVNAQPGSKVLLTTPAAGKFYRSAGVQAKQLQEIRLQDAELEWLPQETIYFGDATARVETRIRLEGESRFIGWEIACYGRPASGDHFASGRVFQSLELWRANRPLVWDRLRLNGATPMMSARWGLQGFAVLGTLLAYPANNSLLQLVREVGIEDGLLSCSVVDQVLICRCVHQHVEVLKQCFVKIWEILRPGLLMRNAVRPRIWAT